MKHRNTCQFALAFLLTAWTLALEAKSPKAIPAGQFAAVTEAAKIRTAADANSVQAECQLVSVGMTHEHLYKTPGWVNEKGDGWRFEKKVAAAPKGAVFEILAASNAPAKVGSWTNYWYRVQTTEGAISADKTAAFLQCNEGELWIFGEFLKTVPKNFKKVKIPNHPGGG